MANPIHPIPLPFASMLAEKGLQFVVFAEGTGQSSKAEDDLGEMGEIDSDALDRVLQSAADKSITLDELGQADVAIAVRAAKIYGAALEFCSETYQALYERHIVALMRYRGGRLTDSVLAAMLDLPQLAHLQSTLHTEDFAHMGELLSLHLTLRGIMSGRQDPASFLNEVIDISVHFALLFGDSPLSRGKGGSPLVAVEPTIKRLTKVMDRLSIDTNH